MSFYISEQYIHYWMHATLQRARAGDTTRLMDIQPRLIAEHYERHADYAVLFNEAARDMERWNNEADIYAAETRNPQERLEDKATQVLLCLHNFVQEAVVDLRPTRVNRPSDAIFNTDSSVGNTDDTDPTTEAKAKPRP